MMSTLPIKILAESHVSPSARSLTPTEVLEAIDQRKEEPQEQMLDAYSKRNRRRENEGGRIKIAEERIKSQMQGYHDHHERQRNLRSTASDEHLLGKRLNEPLT